MFVEPPCGEEIRRCILFCFVLPGVSKRATRRCATFSASSGQTLMIPTDQMTAADRKAERAFVGRVGDWWLAACILMMFGLVVASAFRTRRTDLQWYGGHRAATHNQPTPVR
jgi:hypothetical protein